MRSAAGSALSPSVGRFRYGSGQIAGLGNVWSNPAYWGGTLPTSSDAVVIPVGTTVVLDMVGAVAASVDIQGTLVALYTTDVGLTTQSINIGSAGTFQIGTAGTPYTKNASIILNGAYVPLTTQTFGLIWLLLSIHFNEFVDRFMVSGPGVMRHKSAAATMDQTDIRGLATTVHRSVMEAASL